MSNKSKKTAKNAGEVTENLEGTQNEAEGTQEIDTPQEADSHEQQEQQTDSSADTGASEETEVESVDGAEEVSEDVDSSPEPEDFDNMPECVSDDQPDVSEKEKALKASEDAAAEKKPKAEKKQKAEKKPKLTKYLKVDVSRLSATVGKKFPGLKLACDGSRILIDLRELKVNTPTKSIIDAINSEMLSSYETAFKS